MVLTVRHTFSVRPVLAEGLAFEELCRRRDVKPAVELRRLLLAELHAARAAGELDPEPDDDDAPALFHR